MLGPIIGFSDTERIEVRGDITFASWIEIVVPSSSSSRRLFEDNERGLSVFVQCQAHIKSREATTYDNDFMHFRGVPNRL